MSWTVGVDVGGTFTDFFLSDSATGAVHVHKIPSTPDDPSVAVLSGLIDLRTRLDLPPNVLDRFAHGTTVATNSLIERKGGRVAMITTAGFRDLIEIGRQVRPKVYDLNADAPMPVVPRERRFEVWERIGPGGEVLRDLLDEEIERVVAEVIAADVDSCAVCLLFSFINPRHEQRIGAALKERSPGIQVSLSSDVQPEFREYERFSTTLLNAFLKPKVTQYMDHLASSLAGEAPRASIGISQSSGGLMNIRRASEMPIRTALSGPAAGVVGAMAVAARSKRSDLITLDIGGTSTDVCLIENGTATLAYGRNIADFPVRLPSIDIHTIGAGGGSIAHIGRDGLLKVGPQSAGAAPGPACYGQGGTLPTVTDANVVLGRLPCELVGGGMRLDREAAARAIQPIADRLGLSVEEAALGIIRIVVSNMVRAIRVVSIERGYDPRRFSLMPFGGAGGLHAADVARELGMRDIVIPISPGILCAEGVAVSDLEESFVATVRAPVEQDLAPVRSALARLLDEAGTWAMSIGEGQHYDLSAALDMRYVGQNYELPIDIGNGNEASLPDGRELQDRFFVEHQAKYGHFDPTASVEIINVRLRARVQFGKVRPSGNPGRTPSEVAPLSGPAWFGGDLPVETSIIDRGSLGPGDSLAGPVIITQFDSTTVVPPGAKAHVDEAGNLIMELSA
jgi:N-methylhydantoinase A